MTLLIASSAADGKTLRPAVSAGMQAAHPRPEARAARRGHFLSISLCSWAQELPSCWTEASIHQHPGAPASLLDSSLVSVGPGGCPPWRPASVCPWPPVSTSSPHTRVRIWVSDVIAGSHGPRPPSHPMPGMWFLHCLLGSGCDWGRGTCIHSSRPQL